MLAESSPFKRFFAGGFNKAHNAVDVMTLSSIALAKPTKINGDDRKTLFQLELEAQSLGHVYFHQDYTVCFKDDQFIVPKITLIEIVFRDFKSKKNIVLKIGYKSQVEGYQLLIKFGNQEESVIPGFEDMLPKGADTHNLVRILHRRLWIEINKNTNTFKLWRGDLQHIQKNMCLFQRKLNNVQPVETAVYEFIDQKMKKAQRQVGDFENLKKVDVTFSFLDPIPEAEEKQIFEKFVILEIFSHTRIHGPVVHQNPSLLDREVSNVVQLGPEIQYLFSELKGLCLMKLPGFSVKKGWEQDYFKYTQWKNAKFAIHNSLSRKPGYLRNTPIGILKHMLKLKMGKLWNYYYDFSVPLSAFKDPHNPTQEEYRRFIYQNRAGYLRFQTFENEGNSPGSEAVMEIWPPFHSSTIHDHGKAFGLIKVLAGDIQVENYSDLTFSDDVKPYMINTYGQGGYTYLTPHSYCIHRLVNMYPQTCITLQAYANTEDSREYFSVIKRDAQKKSLKLIEYYPQHDWANYLSYYTIDAIAKSMGKSRNDAQFKEDVDFIRRVRREYGLNMKSGERGDTPKFANQEFKDREVDASFFRFMLVMQQEYDLVANLQ